MPRKHFTVRWFTGPTMVTEIAAKMRAAGLEVTCEGTEHVFTACPGWSRESAAWDALVDVQRKHGTDFGLRASF